MVHTNNFSEKLHKYMTPQATITIRRNLPLSTQLQMQRVQFPGDYDPRELMSDPQREPHLKLSVRRGIFDRVLPRIPNAHHDAHNRKEVPELRSLDAMWIPRI